MTPRPIAPDDTTDTERHWQTGLWQVHARVHGPAWRVERSWDPAAIELTAEPAVQTRFGEGQGVAYFERPIALAGSQRLELWLEWPLELILAAGGLPVEYARPGARQTVLGTVEEGAVLPAFVCRSLTEPSELGPGAAALRVALHNDSNGPVVLKRCPVSETAVDVYLSGDTLLAGTQQVRVFEAGRAEAQSSPLSPPRGATLVRKGVEAPHRTGLSWLLDSTRRSTEFQL